MDFRRRHARAFIGKPGLLPVVPLTSASSATVATRRPLDGSRVFELLNNKIALARDDGARFNLIYVRFASD